MNILREISAILRRRPSLNYSGSSRSRAKLGESQLDALRAERIRESRRVGVLKALKKLPSLEIKIRRELAGFFSNSEVESELEIYSAVLFFSAVNGEVFISDVDYKKLAIDALEVLQEKYGSHKLLGSRKFESDEGVSALDFFRDVHLEARDFIDQTSLESFDPKLFAAMMAECEQGGVDLDNLLPTRSRRVEGIRSGLEKILSSEMRHSPNSGAARMLAGFFAIDEKSLEPGQDREGWVSRIRQHGSINDMALEQAVTLTWPEDRVEGERAVEFVRRAYSNLLDRGLTRSHIRQHDLKLYNALATDVRRNGWPEGFYIPTEKEFRDSVGDSAEDIERRRVLREVRREQRGRARTLD